MSGIAYERRFSPEGDSGITFVHSGISKMVGLLLTPVPGCIWEGGPVEDQGVSHP